MRRLLALPSALLLWSTLSCDRVTGLPTTGRIRIILVSETAALALAQAEATNASSNLYPIGGIPANIALDGARVTVTGPATRTVTDNSPSGGFFDLTVDGLAPGTYNVAVEGLTGGQVAHFGQTTATVVAGTDTDAPVTFPVFQPDIPNPLVVDTVEVLHFNATWPAVPNATSYIVQYSTSPTLASPTSLTVTTNTTNVAVPAEGQYYFAVRSANATVPSGGMASAIKSVIVFQTVTTVGVLPLTPSIVDGTTQQFAAVARDADNVILTNPPTFWASSNHAVAMVNQSGLVTAVGAGQATISAVVKGMPGNATLTVTPQAASKLVFTAPPTNTAAGQSIAEVKVAIQNPKNQVITSDNTTQITVAIAANPGSGALAGTATATVQQGVATFSNLNIDKSGTGYTLTATATALTSATSGAFNITHGAAHHLAFVVQPASTTAGVAFSPALQVEIQDVNNNRVTSARNQVSISIENDPIGGTLSGTLDVGATDGIASFSGVSLDVAAAGYTLRASASGINAGVSGAFTIDPAPVSALLFGTPPVNTSTDDDIIVDVVPVDRFGNAVLVAVPVTVSIATNPAAGTLSGTTTVMSTGGIAQFTDLKINRVGTGYTLQARSDALTSAMSGPFDMTVGAPAKLGFKVQPARSEPGVTMNAMEVAVLDEAGNQTGAAVSVTIALDLNPGAATLSGTLTTASIGGVATFADIVVDSAAKGYLLAATAAGLDLAASDQFDVDLEFTQVRTGDLSTCGITSSGSAYCWGWNPVGGIGDGTGGIPISRLNPTAVLGNIKFSAISVGYAHACGLSSADSTAYCWGWNLTGQLGNNAIGGPIGGVGHATPQPVFGGHKFVRISAGTRHTCAIRAADSLAFCWGEQGNGRLGNATDISASITVPTQVNTGDRFSLISAGGEHTCAVRNDAAGFCWGRQLNGRLGNNLTTDANVSSPTQVLGGINFLEISASFNHTCGVRSPSADRRGYCWGSFLNGALGFTGAVDVGLPTEVARGLKYASIQTGGQPATPFSCGLTTIGTAFCWGTATDGRLGNGVGAGTFDSPQPLLTSLTFLSIDVATPGNSIGGHGCGLTTTGVYCWGVNNSGGLGMLGDGTAANSAVPIRVRGQR